jgi:MFS family permease
MVGLNAVFGFACPFVNAYVNGEVVARVLIKDTNQRFVGLFSALSSAVAALCSLVTGGKSMAKYKGIVLIMGSVSFSMVALPFILSSHFSQWTWSMLAAVYCFQGIGRATFEGTLRSVFADYFPHEREGSYANIILQNGAFTSLGFLLSFYVPCWPQSSHCIEFKDGSLHNMSILEGGIIVVAVVSILGFLQARRIHKIEQAVVQANEEFDLFFPGGHEHGVTGGSESIEAAIRYSCGACG